MKELGALALVASIALVGCSGGTVSATSEQGQGESASTNSILERVKGFFKSEAKSVTIEVPVQTMINETATEWIDERKITYPLGFSYLDLCNYLPEVLQVMGARDDALPKLLSNSKARISAIPQAQRNESDAMVLNFAQVAEKENLYGICGRLQLKKVGLPVAGWYGEPKEMAQMMFFNAFVANEISVRVAQKIADSSAGKTDEFLKQKINQEIENLAKDGTIGQIFAAAVKPSLMFDIQRDMTMKHPAPVHFSLNGYDIAGAGTGIVLSKNGGTIYGDGWIGGKKYTATVQSVSGSTMQKEKTIRDESQTSGEITLTENAGVGN